MIIIYDHNSFIIQATDSNLYEDISDISGVLPEPSSARLASAASTTTALAWPSSKSDDLAVELFSNRSGERGARAIYDGREPKKLFGPRFKL